MSNKWSKAQTITGPYIVVPYNEVFTEPGNKKSVVKKSVILLPENLNVKGDILPQQTHRSIYKVLLYKANLNITGNFSVKIPRDIDSENFLLTEARVCIGLNDSKGIDGKVVIACDNVPYDLNAGIPSNEIDSNGLSTSIF